MELIDFGKGIVIPKTKVINIAEDFIKIVKTELPEEAQCPRVMDAVLNEVKGIIMSKQLKL